MEPNLKGVEKAMRFYETGIFETREEASNASWLSEKEKKQVWDMLEPIDE